MNIYCKSCGSPNAYGSKKPKFCSSCGSPLDSTAKAKVQPAKRSAPKNQVIAQESYEDEEIHEDSTQIPNISRLEADIDSGRIQGVKFGEVAGTATENEDVYVRPQDDKVSPEEALKQLQREGGSIRQKGSS